MTRLALFIASIAAFVAIASCNTTNLCNPPRATWDCY